MVEGWGLTHPHPRSFTSRRFPGVRLRVHDGHRGRAAPAVLHVQPGIHVSARGVNSTTPLHTACLHCPLPVVDALLRAGADVNLQDNDGWVARRCVLARDAVCGRLGSVPQPQRLPGLPRACCGRNPTRRSACDWPLPPHRYTPLQFALLANVMDGAAGAEEDSGAGAGAGAGAGVAEGAVLYPTLHRLLSRPDTHLDLRGV